ncbi:MAG: hypothetical protein ABI367_14490 [Mucilaginibacter sp.]
MKKIIFLAAIGLRLTVGYAQTQLGTPTANTLKSLKIPVDKTKSITVNTSEVSVDMEGYDGDSLIIEDITNKLKKITPPEAEGLKLVKLDDRPSEKNNDISYKLTASGSNMSYQISAPTQCKYLHIKVPNNLYVSINANNMTLGAYLSIKNFVGPFDVSGMIRTIYVSNVAGPFRVMGRGEKVILSNILWKQDAVGPYAYGVSSTGDIDITLPEDLKATITSFPGPANGEIYSDLNLASLSNNGSKGGILKVNGGGVGVFLYNTNTNRGNTYIRKQQK